MCIVCRLSDESNSKCRTQKVWFVRLHLISLFFNCNSIFCSCARAPIIHHTKIFEERHATNSKWKKRQISNADKRKNVRSRIIILVNMSHADYNNIFFFLLPVVVVVFHFEHFETDKETVSNRATKSHNKMMSKKQ